MAKTKQAKNLPLYWKIPLSVFFNETERKTRKTASGETYKEERPIETLQGYSEYLFDNFIFISWTDDSITAEDDEIKEATDYIKSQVKKELQSQSKYTLDDYAGDIKMAVIRAKCDSWDISYQDEYIKKLWKLVFDGIWKTCAELKGNRPYLYNSKSRELDNKPFCFDDTPTDEIWDADEVWIEISKEQAKEELSNSFDAEQLKDTSRYQEYMDEYIAYGNLENSYYQLSSNQKENIDYYNSLGDFDSWLEYFKDQEDISYQIKKDIEEDKAKIDDKKYIHEQITKSTTNIRETLAEYSTDKAYNDQILRQVGSIEATTKKAI